MDTSDGKHFGDRLCEVSQQVEHTVWIAEPAGIDLS
jgi:hypothetical protein